MEHILSYAEVDAIRTALAPRVLIPMHYRHSDLEPGGGPEDLGPIDPWLEGRDDVRRIGSHRVTVSAAGLPDEPEVWVLDHAPYVLTPDAH